MMKHGKVLGLLSAVIAAVLLVWAGQTGAPQQVQLISPKDAVALLAAHAGSPSFVLLDVRTPEEFAQGRIAGAILLDYRGAGFQWDLARLDRSQTYLVYCRTGNRSSYAVRIMAEMGFAHVYDLDGGIVLWEAEGLPLER